MKTFCLLLLLSFFSCTSTKDKDFKTVLTINPDGSSIVTTSYEDSITVVNLNKDGEKIPDSTIEVENNPDTEELLKSIYEKTSK